MIDFKLLSKKVRANALKMVHKAKASHIASALSIVDILTVLYGSVMKFDKSNTDLLERDRLILSKGHACVAVYSVLAEVGIIEKEELKTYGEDFSWLMNHISHKVDGVEFSAGALGHGLSFGVGKALSAKIQKLSFRTFVILSDGEMDEGSTWEALMFAAHHKLDNLTAVEELEKVGVSCDLIDLRSTSPLDTNEIIKSVKKTGRLLAIDSSSVSFSVASEIVARAATEISEDFKCAPSRLALEDLASPSSFGLTKKYYFGSKEIAQKVLEILDLKTKISENVFLKEHPHDVPGDWFKGPF